MDSNSQKGFLDTATSLGETAYHITKAVGHAMAGDFVGAAVTAAKSPIIRKMIIGVCVFVFLRCLCFCISHHFHNRQFAVYDTQLYYPWWFRRIFRSTVADFEYGNTNQWGIHGRLQY